MDEIDEIANYAGDFDEVDYNLIEIWMENFFDIIGKLPLTNSASVNIIYKKLEYSFEGDYISVNAAFGFSHSIDTILADPNLVHKIHYLIHVNRPDFLKDIAELLSPNIIDPQVYDYFIVTTLLLTKRISHEDIVKAMTTNSTAAKLLEATYNILF